MKIVATIEARMTSSRLPGKVMMEVMGKPLIGHLIDRLQKVSNIDEIVMATTVNDTDDVLANYCESLSIGVFRGSENNVRGRVIEAAQSVNADVIAEISGDCPILDYRLVEQFISIYQANNYDIVSDFLKPSYPRGMASLGVFSVDVLKQAVHMGDTPLDQEHVTRIFVQNPEHFSHFHMISGPQDYAPNLFLTVDEDKDYQLVKNIIEHFGTDNALFSCGELVEAIAQNPHWLKINNEISRKGYNK